MSEYAPAGSKPRMTKAQIKELQDMQQEATRIANKKIADSKKTDEYKKEKYILNSLEYSLNNDDSLIVSWNESETEKNTEKKELSFWDKVILWFKKILK